MIKNHFDKIVSWYSSYNIKTRQWEFFPFTFDKSQQKNNNTYKSTTLHGIGISEMMILAKRTIHFQYVQSGMQGSSPPELHAWTQLSQAHVMKARSHVCFVGTAHLDHFVFSTYKSMQCQPPLHNIYLSHTFSLPTPPCTSTLPPTFLNHPVPFQCLAMGVESCG